MTSRLAGATKQDCLKTNHFPNVKYGKSDLRISFLLLSSSYPVSPQIALWQLLFT